MRKSSKNPRWKNGHRRRQLRQRYAAQDAPCSICGGRIRYDQPSDAAHPLSLVVDEIIPVSRWRQAGYSSPEACCQDPQNLAPAHRICNQWKGNKIDFRLGRISAEPQKKTNQSDGSW